MQTLFRRLLLELSEFDLHFAKIDIRPISSSLEKEHRNIIQAVCEFWELVSKLGNKIMKHNFYNVLAQCDHISQANVIFNLLAIMFWTEFDLERKT